MKRLAGGIVAAAVLAGCGPRAGIVVDERDPFHHALPEAPEGDALSVSLRVLTVKGKTERAIDDGEVLHSGDRIALSLRTNQQAHVYVVMLGPDGSANVLFPDGGYGIASPKCALRIPRTSTLYLQDPAGVEDLRVIASARPLGETDRRLCDELHLPCSPAAEASAKAAPCDPPVNETQRGILPAVKIGKAPRGGVAEINYPLRHDP